MRLTGEASVLVPAPTERVWELLADLPRMGDWSPECVGCVWDDPAAPLAVGRTFVGHNRMGPLRWSTHGEIEVFDPPRELVYLTRVRGRDMTRWRYRLDPEDGSTRITEVYSSVDTPGILTALERAVRRPRRLERQMRETLVRLGEAAARD